MTRSWFLDLMCCRSTTRGFNKLFLLTGHLTSISPGFGRLRALMEGKVPAQEAEKELQQYSVFPLYPVGSYPSMTFAWIIHP
jgi:hypothetical protein